MSLVGSPRSAKYLEVTFSSLNWIDKALRVRFLELFDTVHSFGVPGIDLNLFHDPDLPNIVDHCFHALALDERRGAFRPTRAPKGYEVWFRGAHLDIGGGNNNTGLNAITLKWMLCKHRLWVYR